jgi:conjugative transfer pilus assembly protein TraH
MNKLTKVALSAVLFLTPLGALHADVNSDMQTMFTNLGSYGNYSSPTSFTAQGRGYFVGGGISVRGPIKSITPVTIDRPSFQAGCGGIDMHLGSISYAGTEEYVNFFRALPTNAVGYGLKVGLDAISPTLRKAFDSIEEKIDLFNSWAKNSCQASQWAVNNTLGKLLETNLQRCIQRKREDGSDAAAAEQHCKANQNDVEAGGDANTPPGLRPVTGNIVWKALKKIDGLTRQDREFIMSVFGTVVITAGMEPFLFQPTIATFSEFFRGTTNPADPNARGLQIYTCDEEDDCLVLTKQFVNINTFPKLVEDRMRDIARKLIDGEPQSAVNIGFINGIDIPVFRMLVLATAEAQPYENSVVADTIIHEFKDLIAIDLAVAYIDKTVALASAMLRSAQSNMSDVEGVFLTGMGKTGDEFRVAAREERKGLADKALVRRNLEGQLEALQRKLYDKVPDNVRRLLMASR